MVSWRLQPASPDFPNWDTKSEDSGRPSDPLWLGGNIPENAEPDLSAEPE